MRDRLVTFAAAAAALLLTAVLLLPPRGPSGEELSLPTSEDRGGSGLMGLKAWLEQGGIAVYSLRRRYGDLPDRNLPGGKGSVLIVVLPQLREALYSEWADLQDWIAAGNTVVFLNHGYGKPIWAENNDCFCDAVQLLEEFGWDLTSSGSPESDDPLHEGSVAFKQRIEKLQSGLQAIIPAITEILPLSPSPILQPVGPLESRMVPASIGERWHLAAGGEQLAVRLFGFEGDPERTVVWLIEAGQGRIVMSLAGDLFSNDMLNRAGNARLLKQLLSHTLADGGQVIFDDYHFGLSDLYDPEQFFSDSRLYRSVGLIVLFWFLYVLGYSNRLAPVAPEKAKTAMLDSVAAMAGFFAGRLDKKLLARELVKHFIHDIRLKRRLPDEGAVWHWLEQHPQIEKLELDRLKEAMAQRCSRLQPLSETLSEIRTKLLS